MDTLDFAATQRRPTPAVRLDATALERLDAIAAAAARAAGAPYAGVMLIGGALTAAGSFGAFRRVMPRAGSLCDQVVTSLSPLIVDDAAAMPEFAGHPLVADAGVRSYAGVPLADDGAALGTLCVFGEPLALFGGAVLDDLAALAALSVLSLGEPAVSQKRRGSQGWLGVKTSRADRDQPARAGLIVLRVARHSPADRAGLRPADILLQIEERALRRPEDVAAALVGCGDGEAVTVRFLRRGQALSCRAVITGRNSRSAVHFEDRRLDRIE